jgi:hypothetical protein
MRLDTKREHAIRFSAAPTRASRNPVRDRADFMLLLRMVKRTRMRMMERVLQARIPAAGIPVISRLRQFVEIGGCGALQSLAIRLRGGDLPQEERLTSVDGSSAPETSRMKIWHFRIRREALYERRRERQSSQWWSPRIRAWMRKPNCHQGVAEWYRTLGGQSAVVSSVTS